MLSGICMGFADGDVVFSQGDAAADMYVIRSGKVRIYRTHDGEEVTLAVLGAEDFFGEMALFTPGSRTATAVAVGDAEVEVVDRPTFMSLIKDPVVWRMLAKMSERVRLADEALEASPDDTRG